MAAVTMNMNPMQSQMQASTSSSLPSSYDEAHEAHLLPAIRDDSNSQHQPMAQSTSQFGNFGQPQTSTNANFQQPFYLRPAYRFKTTTQARPEELMQDGPGRRLRKNVANVRKHIDYIANVLNHIDCRLWQHSRRDRVVLQPDTLYQHDVLPPSSTKDTPVDCILTKFVRAATNKVKCPIYSLCWTPEGKRVITGASSGEFTLWNGTAFNFETILQAHDVAVRALKWSHNSQWMASADHDGYVKYWQPNMNNVHMFQAHKDEPIRSLSFAPTDLKLCTGSDDGTARIWDFARCVEEKVLRGHGADVRSVDWHPAKGLIATGSRDSQQPVKLWDPKTGQCLATLHDHKNSVMSVNWNRNGNWLLTGSRDHLIKLYDIRMMKEVQSFRGHKKEVTSLAWHPIHEGLFVSGGGDGSLGYWLVNNDKELAVLEGAHDQAIWTLEWHPLGHILSTGSNDNNTKFWARNRPDIFGLTAMCGANNLTAGANMSSSMSESRIGPQPSGNDVDESVASEVISLPIIPGMGLDDNITETMNRDIHPSIGLLPGLGGGNPFDNPAGNGAMFGARRTLIKQPPPKKAQRQFERTWMVSRPSGGNDFEEDSPEFEDGYAPVSSHFQTKEGADREPAPNMRQPKASLLGPPPVNQSLLAQPSQPPAPVKPQQHFPAPQTNFQSGGFFPSNPPVKPPILGSTGSDTWRLAPGAPPPIENNHFEESNQFDEGRNWSNDNLWPKNSSNDRQWRGSRGNGPPTGGPMMRGGRGGAMQRDDSGGNRGYRGGGRGRPYGSRGRNYD
uniref:Uncharacterized protein n=1 Tax=Ditylenchus dipsaci TaxID=166011 RepID=A0A915EFA7_9BILA